MLAWKKEGWSWRPYEERHCFAVPEDRMRNSFRQPVSIFRQSTKRARTTGHMALIAHRPKRRPSSRSIWLLGGCLLIRHLALDSPPSEPVRPGAHGFG